jgi:4-hydroxybenzoate polyprenyltransferase
MLVTQNNMRAWLQILRIHSVALTCPVALIGYVLTHGTIWSPTALFWALYSIFWGFTGNIHNAVVDYNIDVKDPYKKHFPLVSGTISIKTARTLTTSMLISLWSVGVIACDFDPKWCLLLTFGIAAGLSYNWSSKSFGTSALMAGLSFPVPFLLAAHDITNLVTLVYAFLVIQFMLQNGLSGGYKDLESDSTNMVKALGVKINNGIVSQTIACGLFSVGTRVLMLAILVAVSMQVGFVPYMIIPFILLIILVLQQATLIKYVKREFMLLFALIEMMSYYMLLLTILSILNLTESVFLALFPITIYIAFNKISWGSTITPKT